MVTQEDLPYIISDVLKHDGMSNKVKLKSYFVTLAHGLKPMATLSIEIDGQVYEESSSGDGQYDAFVRALRKIYKVTLGRKFPMLINYAVSILPEGEQMLLCKPLSPGVFVKRCSVPAGWMLTRQRLLLKLP